MSTIYPQHLDHNSEDFIKIKNEMMEILNATHKGATVSVDVNDSTRLNATFTLDYKDEFYYLQADCMFSKWLYDNGNPTTPLYTLTNYRIVRHGATPDDNISDLLTYIFTSEESIHDKFKEYLHAGVEELRTDKVATLKMNLHSLKYGQRREWW